MIKEFNMSVEYAAYLYLGGWAVTAVALTIAKITQEGLINENISDFLALGILALLLSSIISIVWPAVVLFLLIYVLVHLGRCASAHFMLLRRG